MFRDCVKVAFLIFLFSACAPSVAPVSATEREPLPNSTPQARANMQSEILISPDGRLLASAGCDRTVRLWEVKTGKPLRSLRHADEVMAVVFSPDGALLISGGYDNQIYVWGLPAN